MKHLTQQDLEEIEAFDFDDKPSKRPKDNFKFRVSVYGILEENGKVLVQAQKGLSGYSLPGGSIEIGERIEKALVREFKEETGLDVKPIKQIEVRDDFVTFSDGQDYHSILIFYLVERAGGELMTESNGFDSDEAIFLPLQELLDGKIRRIFQDTLEKVK